MGGMIPLGDASRRTARWPVVTALLIAANAYAFFLELTKGERFVSMWSVVPWHIVNGYGWITILTAMFLHGSWSHIIGNMLFFWAFAPEMEATTGRIVTEKMVKEIYALQGSLREFPLEADLAEERRAARERENRK
jgi:membrane associated rhomboid family serine protease